MNAPDKFFLPDVQASQDHRALAIQRVGVRGLRYPLVLLDGDRAQHTVATIEMTVGLPADVKGTHMSRFVELLEVERGGLDLSGLRALFADMLVRLEATSGRIEARFPWFMRKTAPVSGVASLLDLDVTLVFEQTEHASLSSTLIVTVPVTSLCPCSKKISEYGAHNQRSHITIAARLRGDLEIGELVRMAEEEASCEVFGLLKRPDEKWVTERAYDNPKFVEDLVRDIALRLGADRRIASWRVESENFESIHNHSAYALIEGENPEAYDHAHG
ncbi:GTP cyclohydrolase I FolE2 [Azoarcus communis]|uniref:GTP cyclohydrolase FolE2 n=1 Tax=Parazoarcus communis TaxID=41977 RepID=UPI001459AEC4|nr:GTP cyclohydrolase FolE2 [Parazoarcus communis]NMG50307.1 GTP cyclohydrolase I FolE2 [Parazoarcus communis]